MNDFDHKIGRQLHNLREARRYTQEKIGGSLGVTSQKIEAYEMGMGRI